MLFVSGMSEKQQRELRKRKIGTAMRPHTTLWRLLVHPKDKLEPRVGVYSIDVRAARGSMYEGKTKRKLKSRMKEHIF